MANKITAAELANMHARGSAQLIDICSPTEYASGHVPGAVNIPMEQIRARIADLRIGLPVVLICKSGQRACATAQLLKGSTADVLVLDGGTRAWRESGRQMVVNTRTGWSLERQVRLGAGLLVLVGILLLLVWNRVWIAVSAFVGFGLTFAGLTDICAMAFLLAKMPWNKVRGESERKNGKRSQLCCVTDLAEGDEQCQNALVNFETLANEHKDSVYRQMLRVCGNQEDAEDVLIEALLKAYQHIHQLNDPAAFRAWLAQIARRVCWHLKKREALSPLLQLSMLEDEGAEIKDPKPPVDSELALRRMKELMENAVSQLPPSAREVFVLRDMEELSGEEVARRLGISLASMKSRLHRARKLLRENVDAALTGNAEEAQSQS